MFSFVHFTIFQELVLFIMLILFLNLNIFLSYFFSHPTLSLFSKTNKSPVLSYKKKLDGEKLMKPESYKKKTTGKKSWGQEVCLP